MIKECPHCQKPLSLNDAQLDKVQSALSKLANGKFLKLGCPNCQIPIELKADGTYAHAISRPIKNGTFIGGEARETSLEPPTAPDLGWLQTGKFEEQTIIGDVPTALVLINDESAKEKIEEAYTERGVKVIFPESVSDAIDKMRFVKFSSVVFHSGYEGGKLDDSVFHAYMRVMPMSKRRYTFYALIGPEFNTLYDLEALSNSANLVVNDKDINSINLILRKSIHEYETLFGPYIEALKEQGNQAANTWIEMKGKVKTGTGMNVLKDLLMDKV